MLQTDLALLAFTVMPLLPTRY